MTGRATFLTAALAAGALAITSCGSGEADPDPATTPPSQSSAAPETSPDDAATETEAAEDQEDHQESELSGFSQETISTEEFPSPPEGWEESQHLVDVRIGHHEGYDRVVFEHSGPSELAYQVEYIDQPTDQGMGEPVDVPGEVYLSVSVAGLGTPPDEYDPDATLSGPVEGVQTQSQLIQGIHALGTFEGQSSYFIGLDQPRDFRVQMAEDPVRIIIDLAH